MLGWLGKHLYGAHMVPDLGPEPTAVMLMETHSGKSHRLERVLRCSCAQSKEVSWSAQALGPDRLLCDHGQLSKSSPSDGNIIFTLCVVVRVGEKMLEPGSGQVLSIGG